MQLATFSELVGAARAQPEPQRLLLVFATAELPEDADAGQRARFEAGEGGVLTPLMCVDKDPATVAGFEAIAAESREFGRPWAVLFAAALGGSGGRPPTEAQVGAALDRMVESVRAGEIGAFVPFGPDGHALRLY
jgi:hypothetical protein